MRPSKDYLFTRFIYPSIYPTLSMDKRKENVMNTIALAILFTVRVIIPLTVLLALGEWVKRREKNYWLHK